MTQDKPKRQQNQQEKSKQSKQEQDKQQKQKQKQSPKKDDKAGGAFVSDVKNLAVPFAILLAKEGLSKYFKDDKKSASKSTKSTEKKSTKSSSTSSVSRRRTMAGGSCNLGCGALTGGAAAKQLVQLQQQIDNFLEKY
jgi:hypothetical protein